MVTGFEINDEKYKTLGSLGEFRGDLYKGMTAADRSQETRLAVESPNPYFRSWSLEPRLSDDAH